MFHLSIHSSTVRKEKINMASFYYSIYGPFIEQYVAMQISLGYKPKERVSVLAMFDKWILERDEETVSLSKELVEEWGVLRMNESEINRYKRIQGVRLFASFLCKIGYPSHIADLPRLRSTFTPYIFTDKQISAFFAACDRLDAFAPNHSATIIMPALFRLLYATGLRIGEALALTCNEVSLKDNYLVVRNGKNGMDRAVPFPASLARVLSQYLAVRRTYSEPAYNPSDHFFLRPDGRIYTVPAIYRWFRKILYRAGISHGGIGIGPRIHDFRHTFACHSLAQMTRSGLDLYYSLPILSTYLGHRSLSATDGYIRLTAQMYPDLTVRVENLAPNLFSNLLNDTDHETN